MIYKIGNVRAEIIKPGMPLKKWLEKQAVKPFALINASLYESSVKPIGTIIEGGKMVSSAGNGFGFGVLPDKSFGFGAPWDKPWQDYITGYTGIVQSGKYVPPTFRDAYVFDCKLSRVGLGTVAGVLTIGCYDGVDIDGLGRAAVADGFNTFINLDGGGSRFLYYNGRIIYDSTRTPYNAIAFYADTDPQKEEKPVTETKKPLVYLDAGHGGTDISNQSPDGAYKEHTFTLDMARRVKALLEKAGVRVGMTRSTDGESVSLADRAKRANSAGADCFVSIHSNAEGGGGWGNASGLCAYTYAEGGERDKLARHILDAMRGAYISVFGAGLYHNKYAVLAQTTMPAVLIECGFHTNRDDVARLSDSAYRDILAAAICKGVCAWLGVELPEEAEETKEVKTEANKETNSLLICPHCGKKLKIEKG